MKSVSTRVLPLILLSLFSGLSTNAVAFTTFRGTVEKVVDGDTIRFRPNGMAPEEKAWSIRMLSTDTPETHLPAPGGIKSQGYWGEAAHEQLASIIAVGETVEVDNYGSDHYGRVLGRIFKRGNIDVNLEMMKSGWAALYVICDGDSCDDKESYREACDMAMDNGDGIFNPRKRLPQLPFIFRSIHQQRPLSKFVGNVQTGKYYPPEQYGKVPLCDRIFFMSVTDARKKGYTPAVTN